MADPFTQIPNELLEALARLRIPGEPRQVLDVILRRIYGFHKKLDAISLSQFCLATGLKRNTVCKAIKKLLFMNLITKKGTTTSTIYAVNKDFETWKPLPKRGLAVSNWVTIITNMGNKHSPKGDIQNIKEKINSKESPSYQKIKTKDISEYFISKVFSVKGMKYSFAGKKDGAILKRFAENPEVDYKELIDFFLTTKKSEEHLSLSACFSTDTINQFKLKKAQYPQKVIQRDMTKIYKEAMNVGD